jgi:nitrogen regulatory protein P-II 1
MKKIEAIFRPFKIQDVTNALTEVGVAGMTISEVKGVGHEKGHQEIYSGSEYTVGYLPKVKFEIVTSDDQVHKGVKAIVKAAKTGKIGDGKVFVLGIEILRARRGLAARWRGIRGGAGPGSLCKEAGASHSAAFDFHYGG